MTFSQTSWPDMTNLNNASEYASLSLNERVHAALDLAEKISMDQYQNEQPLEDRLSYNAAEESARDSKAGLWMDKSPIPPWEWRKGGATRSR